MPRIKPLLVLCAALLTVTPAASADVNSDMNQFFNTGFYHQPGGATQAALTVAPVACTQSKCSAISATLGYQTVLAASTPIRPGILFNGSSCSFVTG